MVKKMDLTKLEGLSNEQLLRLALQLLKASRDRLDYIERQVVEISRRMGIHVTLVDPPKGKKRSR